MDPKTDKNAQEFLKSKGFDPGTLSADPKTVDLATRQKQIGAPSVSSPASLSPTTTHSPQDYFRSYGQVAEWVDRSLDIYHPELHVILWPLFVHTFIGIVSQSGQSPHQVYSREGKQFLEKFSPAFLDGTPREGGDAEASVQGEYVQEIRHFYSLSSKELLDLSNTIKCYRTYRYNVSLSRETFQLFVLFLQESGLVLMSSIFNTHVHVRIIARLPQEIDVEQLLGGGDRGGLTGIPKGAEEEMMRKELWGAGGRPDPPVITPLSDIRDRVAATSKPLPSICFFTLLNSHETMASADLSADLKSVAVATTENTVRVYNIAQDDTIRNGPLEKCHILRGHSGAVTGVSYSPCRRFLLSSSVDTTARLWSLETKQTLATYKFHSFPVWDVQFSPGGYFFATASNDRTALLWSTDSSSPRRVFAGHLSDVETLQFSPNCNYLATGSSDKTVRLWDVNTGDCVRLFSGHLGGIHAIAFSPDGKMIATAGEDKRILVWDIATGNRLATLRGHLSDIWTLAFEDNVLASGSADYTVRLWDINAASSSSSSSPPSSRRKGEPSPHLLASFPTKKTPVLKLKFRRNLLLGCGPFSV
eukprot:CAMPEP_0201517784 /NCGR_PEP_ID=MMETSP0161_2-20130828/8810_1 /ASSEMBLY_ACC=CAM_ASM_000251 /TAXON_ID=180227 /ORGANISM="Neoparamoeba aestuarina, Strain SoJaBio B1-5/56/2" /LENGTH=587 /DNA_ID=CAMNT_0047915395 /DNA_START=77 /DNA_END=1840 /DNA_ORIENTATION=-